MTEEQELERIYDAIKSLTAEINALTDELGPYFGNKRTLEEELRKIDFLTGRKHTVQSTKFCGISDIARSYWLKKCGWIIAPGYHFIAVELTVLERNRRGIADRRIIFSELLELAEEWGPMHNQLRDLKADRDAHGRRIEALKAIITRRNKQRAPRG